MSSPEPYRCWAPQLPRQSAAFIVVVTVDLALASFYWAFMCRITPNKPQ